MPTSAKCVFWSHNLNLSGRAIQLTITNYDDKTIEIVVNNHASEKTLSRKSVILSLVVILNLISLVFQIISANYCIGIMVVMLFVVYNVAFTTKQERLVIVQSLGYQIETQYAWGQTTRFIAWEHIKSIFINEVVSKQRVIFILAILTKDTAKEASAIIPLFTETMPRLQCLEDIYRYVENCHG